MKQYRVTADMFNPKGNNPGVPDAYVNPADLKQYGVHTNTPAEKSAPSPQLPNLGKVQQERNIKPGTEEWFKLWFSRTPLTGEKPY
jgi:hypothetical protein